MLDSLKHWWWLALVISCHHDADDTLLPCPAHSWKTPPAPSKVQFGDACRGLDHAACTAKCDAGDPVACTEAGVELGSAHTSYREQLRLYTRACELGDMLGCTNLGATVRFDSPEWSPKKPNLACAADLFELTCAAGEPNGCGELGFAYADAEGRPRDLGKAVAAFKRGCLDIKLDTPVIAQSAAIACSQLLENIDSGKLGTTDPAMLQAVDARLCELGHCRHDK